MANLAGLAFTERLTLKISQLDCITGGSGVTLNPPISALNFPGSATRFLGSAIVAAIEANDLDSCSSVLLGFEGETLDGPGFAAEAAIRLSP